MSPLLPPPSVGMVEVVSPSTKEEHTRDRYMYRFAERQT